MEAELQRQQQLQEEEEKRLQQEKDAEERGCSWGMCKTYFDISTNHLSHVCFCWPFSGITVLDVINLSFM